MLITYSLIRGHFRYMSLLVGQLWIWIPNYSSFFLHPTSLQKVLLKKSMDFSVKTVIELPYLSLLVPVKNEFVTTISPAVHLK